MADKFEDLRTFAIVMSAGGVNAAAAEIGISKSAVSRRMSDLEQRLGVTLFSRTTRRFEPTPIGLEYYRRARDILGSIEELDAGIITAGNLPRVTVCAHRTVTTHLLLPRLRAARMDVAQTIIRFAQGAADPFACEILVGGDCPPGWISGVVATTALVTCASPEYLADRGTPRGPEDYARHARIVAAAGDIPAWCSANATAKPPVATVHVPDVESAAAAAVAGLGLVQLPDYAVADDMASGRLVTVPGWSEQASTTLRAVRKADAPPAVSRVFAALTRTSEELASDRS